MSPGPPLNGLSFDLEDWYQVLYFEDHISRAEWASQESRLAGVTKILLELLDEFEAHPDKVFILDPRGFVAAALEE